jgi:hypothetical protein
MGARIPFEVDVEAGVGNWQQAFGTVILAERRSASVSGWWLVLLLLVVLVIVGVCGLSGALLLNRALALEEARAAEIAALQATQTAIFQATTDTELIIAATATTAVQDVDGDGLTTEQEIALGTDPMLFDTDGDGLSDSIDPDPLNPFDLSQPDAVVVDYYTKLNNRDYASAYPTLTMRFRQSTGTTTFEAYTAWWDQVARIEIGTVYIQQQSNEVACVYAELTYYMIDGSAFVDESRQIILLRDPASGRWLIDEKRAH